jgi:DnaJ domain
MYLMYMHNSSVLTLETLKIELLKLPNFQKRVDLINAQLDIWMTMQKKRFINGVPFICKLSIESEHDTYSRANRISHYIDESTDLIDMFITKRKEYHATLQNWNDLYNCKKGVEDFRFDDNDVKQSSSISSSQQFPRPSPSSTFNSRYHNEDIVNKEFQSWMREMKSKVMDGMSQDCQTIINKKCDRFREAHYIYQFTYPKLEDGVTAYKQSFNNMLQDALANYGCNKPQPQSQPQAQPQPQSQPQPQPQSQPQSQSQQNRKKSGGMTEELVNADLQKWTHKRQAELIMGMSIECKRRLSEECDKFRMTRYIFEDLNPSLGDGLKKYKQFFNDDMTDCMKRFSCRATKSSFRDNKHFNSEEEIDINKKFEDWTNQKQNQLTMDLSEKCKATVGVECDEFRKSHIIRQRMYPILADGEKNYKKLFNNLMRSLIGTYECTKKNPSTSTSRRYSDVELANIEFKAWTYDTEVECVKGMSPKCKKLINEECDYFRETRKIYEVSHMSLEERKTMYQGYFHDMLQNMIQTHGCNTHPKTPNERGPQSPKDRKQEILVNNEFIEWTKQKQAHFERDMSDACKAKLQRECEDFRLLHYIYQELFETLEEGKTKYIELFNEKLQKFVETSECNTKTETETDTSAEQKINKQFRAWVERKQSELPNNMSTACLAAIKKRCDGFLSSHYITQSSSQTLEEARTTYEEHFNAMLQNAMYSVECNEPKPQYPYPQPSNEYYKPKPTNPIDATRQREKERLANTKFRAWTRTEQAAFVKNLPLICKNIIQESCHHFRKTNIISEVGHSSLDESVEIHKEFFNKLLKELKETIGNDVRCRRPHVVRDPYNVLGLKPGALPTDIRKAYRRIMIQLHPDKANKNYNANKLHELRAAYNTLNRKV